MESRDNKPSPLTVGIASALVPGLGYALIGQRWRALLTGGGIIALFVLGVFFAGIRVLSVPGYEDGYLKYIEARRVGDSVYLTPTTQPILSVREGPRDLGNRPQYIITRQVPGGTREETTTERPMGQRWVMLNSPFGVIGDNLWFLGQMLAGPMCAIAGYLSNVAAQAGVAKSVGRLADIGSLYTAVAGMLNLLVIIDSSSRAAGRERRR